MTRVKGGTVARARRKKVLKELRDTLVVNIDYIRQLTNKWCIQVNMHIEIEDKIKGILENYGLQE